MDKRVGVIHLVEEISSGSLRKRLVDRLCGSGYQVERSDFGDVSKTGQQSQRFLRRIGKTAQLPGHKVCNVVGEALSSDASNIPLPGGRVRVERNQPVFRQRSEKLNHKERIACGLLKHQFRQRSHVLRFSMQRVGD